MINLSLFVYASLSEKWILLIYLAIYNTLLGMKYC